MSLSSGQRVGPYEIVAPLGAGGMGEVFRARDTRLGRDVALKVLPPAFTEDPERLARFEREAKLLAALNHPHVATLHGLEETDGQRVLVMELAEGEDLKQRLERGPISVDEPIPIARQVAEALEAAHEKGIVHRDLKPANVKVSDDGTVKVLDFGLAKAWVGEAMSGSGPDLSQSPTLAHSGTAAGVILGTAAYMSPEQARGKSVDKRADIWAFGSPVRDADGDNPLRRGDGQRHPGRGSPPGARLGDPSSRDAPHRATPAAPVPRARPEAAPSRPRRREGGALGPARGSRREPRRDRVDDSRHATALAVGRRPPRRPRRGCPPGALRPAAERSLTPSGSLRDPGARRRLRRPVSGWLACRLRLERAASRARARSPRDPRARGDRRGDPALLVSGRSHDRVRGRRQGLACARRWGDARPHLRRPRLHLGPGRGWGLAARRHHRLLQRRVRPDAGAGGGRRSRGRRRRRSGEGPPLPCPERAAGGAGLPLPDPPQGRPRRHLELWADGQRKQLLQAEGQALSSPVYSPTGHILYRRSPTNSGVWALPFSLADLKTRGEPFLVAAGGRDPSASANGTILYLPESPTPPGRLSWVDREGANVGQIGEAREMRPAPALSPDGTRVAVPENNDGKWDLWLYDLERDTRTRLTSDGSVVMASWVPDGQSLVFESHPTGRASVLRRVAADGSGEVEDLAPGRGPTVSKNGAFVLFWRSIGGQDADLFYRPFEEGGEPVVLRAGDTVDAWPRLSPDGRLVAYVSHSGGEWQVFLTRFPSGEGRWQVTTEGGRWPRWSADGRSLFFAQQDALFEVPVTDGTEVHLGRARLLFTRAPLSRSGHVGGFDVSSDGQRFLIVEPESSVAPERSVVIVLNWAPGLGPGS